MMDRRLLLASLWAGPAAAQSSTSGRDRAELSARDRADLTRAEGWFNRLVSLKARFLQIAQNGAAAEGTAWIVRPGRMRFEYDPPEPLLLIASDGQFFHFDRELRQPTIVPIGSTPLGLLLRPELRFSGDIAVERVERTGGLLRIAMHRAGRAAEGRLTLVFDEATAELRQWAVVDAQARETRVSLFQAEFGGRFPDLLFAFNDPRFRETLGIQ